MLDVDGVGRVSRQSRLDVSNRLLQIAEQLIREAPVDHPRQPVISEVGVRDPLPSLGEQLLCFEDLVASGVVKLLVSDNRLPPHDYVKDEAA